MTNGSPRSWFVRIACGALVVLGLMVAWGCDSNARSHDHRADSSNVAASTRAISANRPNIVVILTDDLGYGELGCYGQKLIRTPNLDELASQGLRFTQAYSGSPVCAPSRCTLLTGLHTGHAAIRDNKEIRPEGQEPLPESSMTIAQALKACGYATAAIGKWGLGPPGSSGDPAKHGFDSFFGYMCQRHAHNHCPPYLYRDGERFVLPGNRDAYESGNKLGEVYAPDLMREEALAFIDRKADAPFFLLFATPVPHMAMQAPEEAVAEYRGRIEEKPYEGASYLKHPEPHAAYAAMVTRMDRDVGAILARLRERCVGRDTLVIFSSDNGPTINVGGADSTFFESTAGLRGRKMDLYEGGIRVPLIVAWVSGSLAGRVRGEPTTPVASWDLFPTIATLCGAAAAAEVDGLDLSPVFLGVGGAPVREYLYWEYPAGKGWQAARIGDIKVVRRDAKRKPPGPIEVYDLASDPAETTDIAAARPDIVSRAEAIFARRTPSPLPEWNYE